MERDGIRLHLRSWRRMEGVDREIIFKITTKQSIDVDCSIWDDEMRPRDDLICGHGRQLLHCKYYYYYYYYWSNDVQLVDPTYVKQNPILQLPNNAVMESER